MERHTIDNRGDQRYAMSNSRSRPIDISGIDGLFKWSADSVMPISDRNSRDIFDSNRDSRNSNAETQLPYWYHVGIIAICLAIILILVLSVGV